MQWRVLINGNFYVYRKNKINLKYQRYFREDNDSIEREEQKIMKTAFSLYCIGDIRYVFFLTSECAIKFVGKNKKYFLKTVITIFILMIILINCCFLCEYIFHV